MMLSCPVAAAGTTSIYASAAIESWHGSHSLEKSLSCTVNEKSLDMPENSNLPIAVLILYGV